MIERPSGSTRVVLSDLEPRRVSWNRRRAEFQLEHLRRIVRIDPVSERRPEIHQRIAEGRHLPVENRHDAAQVVGVEHQIVVLEIIVDQGDTGLRRHVGEEPGGGCFHRRDVIGLGGSIAPGPALDLTPDVAVRAAEVGQAGVLVVHSVQLGQGIDHRIRDRRHGLRIGLLGNGHPRSEHDPFDSLHQVERCAEHLRIRTIDDRFGNFSIAAGERRENPKLASHVMGGLDLGAERRSPQHKLEVGNRNQIGEIREAAGELADLDLLARASRVSATGRTRRLGQHGQLTVEISTQSLEVEFLSTAHRGGSVNI